MLRPSARSRLRGTLDHLRRLQAASLDTQRIYTLDFTTMLESRRLYPTAKITATPRQVRGDDTRSEPCDPGQAAGKPARPWR
jgi:hypothetical protein